MSVIRSRPPGSRQATQRFKVLAGRLGVALCVGFVLGTAHAESGRLMPQVVLPVYVQECAACHTAYPPGMLPARSWQRLMGGLDQHFGTDASLDPATVQQLAGWLQAHAGTYKRVAKEPSEDRITRSAWFVRKHRHIELGVWLLPSVKTAANCAACHTGTEQGLYDDNRLQMPAGLSPRQRRAWQD
ncbi:MAG: diheme cytochrome c [Hydrogenophaga sp.]|nr:diheme cytochrome c [Hydrogenophaga sp.]